MKTWADNSMPVDRSLGEGPRPCCAKAIVLSDALVFVGDLPAIVASLRASRPDLAGIADTDLWICDGCRERAFRHKHVSREDWCRAHGKSAAQVASAWVHDEEYWHRGLTSAPDEVKQQSWWSQYQAFAHAPDEPNQPGSSRSKFRGRVQQLMREWVIPDETAVATAPLGKGRTSTLDGATATASTDTPEVTWDPTTPDVSAAPPDQSP
jgi:hypothetical protein